MNPKIVVFTIFCFFFQLTDAGNHVYKISGTMYHTTDTTDNYKPWFNMKLSLYNKDGDDLLGETETDAHGDFVITGSENEEEIPHPYLYFTTGVIFLELNK